MEVPIVIDGEQAGVLTIQRRGSVTVMDARLRDVGRVVRLSLFGKEGEAYLGVPVPEGEGLRLVRRISPCELKRFPRTPECAGERGKHPGVPEAGREKDAARRVLWHGGKAHYF